MPIENVAAKATRVLGMLYRVLRGADAKTRKMAYFTLVRSILEYGCAAWDLYLSRDIKTLEQIQIRALRFIFRLQGRVSFTDLRKKTNIIIKRST